MAEAVVKIFRRAEIAKNNNSKCAQIIINNSVYEVTKFLKEHPGGEEALLEYAGKDGTEAFESVGHSNDARELLKTFKIGKLHEEDRPKTKK